MTDGPDFSPQELESVPAKEANDLADRLFRHGDRAGLGWHLVTAWLQWLETAKAPLDESRNQGKGVHYGGHQLLERIGEGGFGIVYRACRPAPAGGVVALKVLKGPVVGLHVARLFEREVALAARLDDPRTVKLLGWGVVDGRPYLVSELVEHAEPITRHCRRHRVGLRTCIQLLSEVARGVSHAHQRGVLHRDLKPSNILVQQVPGTEVARVRIVDFGLARAVSLSTAGNSLWSLEGWLLGTPAYMAPEQAQGRRDVDVRVDVYAIGVLMFELLTGSLPWHDEVLLRADAATQLRAVGDGLLSLPSVRLVSRGPAELPWRADALRGELDWIVQRALAEAPADRYPDAASLAADLERFLAGGPVSAAPRSFGYPLRCWLRRRPAAAIGLAATVLVLLISLLATFGLAWSAAGHRRERLAGQLAAEETLRRFDLLAAGVRLRRAELLAETLYPANPAMVTALRDWMVAHGEPLRAGRDDLAAAVRAERALAESADPRAHLALLREGERLLDSMDEFLATGAYPKVRERLERWSLSPQGTAEAWARATAEIAADPRFAGFVMSPQPDLVPLGRDLVTGLQEFAHAFSGEVPRRASDGRLQRSPIDGIVLVLVPGGTFDFGEQGDDPAQPNYNVDAQPSPWFPVVPASIAPFLIGKFEVTRHQWGTMGGAAVDAHSWGGGGGMEFGPDHPIGDVDWWNADLVLRRLGLVLPTAVQWECAARAGTTTPWWIGDDPAVVAGLANFADRSMQRAPEAIYGVRCNSELDDGYPGMAPIGRFPANPFGIHDIFGNVSEWCADHRAIHLMPARVGDGARFGPNGRSRMAMTMSVRGGGFEDHARIGTAASRHNNSPSHRRPAVGLRAARMLSLPTQGDSGR